MLSTEKLADIHAKGLTIGQWQKNRQKSLKKVLAVVLCLALFIGIGSILRGAMSMSTENLSQDILVNSTETAMGNKALRVFIPAAKAAGWSKEQLMVEEQVNPALDHSKAGARPFLAGGFKTPIEAINWLKSGSKEARGVIYLAQAYTDCTEQELFDTKNWVTAQSRVSFSYKGMTLWNGSIKTQAGYKGNAGDIFLSFVAPRSDKIAVIRSGCANPTLFIPTPDEPAPVTTTTTAPSSEEETAPPVTKPGETTVPETKPPKTTKPETTKAPKDPSKDVLANPKVADWKKNGGELLAILWDTEASNGLQIDPIKDAAEKAAAIVKANELLKEEHESALTTAVVVDSNQGHGSVTPPPTTSGEQNNEPTTKWSPFG